MNTLLRSLAPWLSAVAASIALAIVFVGTASDGASAAPQAKVVNAVDFRSDMRMLWEDHIAWTRMYIVSAAADLPDRDAVAARLLRNQTDIGNAIVPYFGQAAGTELTTLLKEHIQGAVAVVAAAKAGDNTALDAANAAWYANADEIATFLSSANPDHWPPAAMKSEMKHHLDVTLAEASAHLSGDTAADIQGYDAVHQHILRLADTLSTGILDRAASAGSTAALPAALPKTGRGTTADGDHGLALFVLLAAWMTVVGIMVFGVRPVGGASARGVSKAGIPDGTPRL